MRSRKIILAILCSLFVSSLSAQKMTSGYLYPAGGQVGTTVEIEAGGLNITKAKKVVFNHPGITGKVEPLKESATKKRKRRRLGDQSSPQLADRVKITVTIADNVPCGLYDLRLQSPQGLSNKLPFEVSSYPNFVEDKNNRQWKQNRVTELPAVLCGQVTPGGIDYFRFRGNKGETIVASVKARQLVPYIADAVPGWFQPVIKIVDAKGKEVAYSDDYYHNVDPVIITTLPKSGEYTLTIHDAIYRGREDFNYRIELGVIPFVTGRYPAYGVAGKRVKQQIEGVNLDEKAKATVKVKTEGYHQLTYKTDVGTSNAVSFYALPKGMKIIQSPEDYTELSLTHAIVDNLTEDAKIKRYKVVVEKRKPLIVELIGRRNSSRIDAVIRLRDRYGNLIKEVDDTEDPIQGLMTFHADPVLKYTPKMNGEMILEVEDRHQGYGKEYHYLLRRHEQLPEVNAFVSPAYITVPSGGTAIFNVDVKGKMRRPAHLEIKGLPKGFTTSSLKLRGRRWDVSVTAPKGADVERTPIELKLDYKGKDGREQVKVLPVDKMTQAFYYIHHIPAAELAVDVVEPSPYRMSLTFDLEEEQGFKLNDESIAVKIVVDKNADFNEPIELMLGKKNKIFSLDPISIMPEEKEKTIHIKLNQTALERFKGKKSKPTWQQYIVGTVKGEVIQRGRRRFQNAKHREITPIFIIKLER